MAQPISTITTCPFFLVPPTMPSFFNLLFLSDLPCWNNTRCRCCRRALASTPAVTCCIPSDERSNAVSASETLISPPVGIVVRWKPKKMRPGMIDEPRIARLEAGCFCRFCRFCFFPQQRKGLQPRIAPVCTGAGAGSGSTRFQRRFRRGSARFRRRFRRRSGTELGQVQQGSEEGSGEGSGRLWCRARSGSTGFRRRFRKRAIVQSHVRFNSVSEKVPGEVGGLGAEPR